MKENKYDNKIEVDSKNDNTIITEINPYAKYIYKKKSISKFKIRKTKNTQ